MLAEWFQSFITDTATAAKVFLLIFAAFFLMPGDPE